MILTLLNSGASYLLRSSTNRVRANFVQVAFGAGSGYSVSSGALGFLAAPVLTTSLDILSLIGDTATFQVTLDESVAITFGEVAVITDTGVFAAMNVAPAVTVKTLGTSLTLTLTLTTPGLGARLTYNATGVSLSKTRLDWDSALLQLQSAAIQTDSFSGLLVANETGQALLELMAGVVELDSATVESAYQENFPDTAKLASSQYAIQTLLRNRLTRSNPTQCTVTLSRVSTASGLSIPPYTQFTSGSVLLFNRDAVVFNVGIASLSVTLYEGQIKTISAPGKGVDYQFFVSTDTDFSVSDTDVRVFVDSRSIPVVVDSLWNYSGVDAVQDSTNKFGALQLQFGNSVLATKPLAFETIYITYVVTKGTSAFDSTFSGSNVACSAYPAVSGSATSGLSGGGDPPSLAFYQQLGGDYYGGKKGAVTRTQYRAKAIDYPGVVDAIVLGQRDLAPYDYRWFNTAKVVLLTETPWSPTDISNFTSWYQQRTMYSMRYVVTTGSGGTEPRTRLINVSLNVFCFSSANLSTVQSAVTGAIQRLFTPRVGILSRDIHRTDITDAAREAGNGLIDYIDLLSPTDTVIADISYPTALTLSSVVGTLAAGTYTYGVTAVDADGETAPMEVNITLSAIGGVKLDWTASPGAVSYNVYGRSAGSLGTMLAATTALTFTDDGTVVPAPPSPPSINLSGVHYPVLNSLSVTVAYTTRRNIT